jgi:hypothetical protein
MGAQHITPLMAYHFVQGVAQDSREFYLKENDNAGGLCAM